MRRDILGQTQMGHGMVRQSGLTGLNGHARHLFGGRGRLIERSHVLKQGVEIYFLMVVIADVLGRHLAGNGQNRGMVQPGIIKSIEQMHRPRTRGAHADPRPPVNLA